MSGYIAVAHVSCRLTYVSCRSCRAVGVGLGNARRRFKERSDRARRQRGRPATKGTELGSCERDVRVFLTSIES